MQFPPSEMHSHVRTIAELLKGCPIGGEVTFSAMSGAVGFDIKDRPWLYRRALQLAQKEAGCLLANIRGVGYKRCHGSESHLLGHMGRRRIHRISRRTADGIERVLEVTNDISPEDERRARAEVNALSLIGHLSLDRTVAKMADATVEGVRPGEIVRALIDHLGRPARKARTANPSPA